MLVLACAAILAGRAVMERSRPASAASGDVAAPRVVALSPALAVTLRDLGAAGQIVGRHGHDLVLDPAIPVCGDQAGIDYEALLRARPTHVLLEWGARPLPQRLRRLARQQGWHVRSFAQLTLDDIEETTAALYELMAPSQTEGGAVPAWSATPIAHAFAEAWRPRPGALADAGRILLLAGVDPVGVLGPGSFHHQILVRMGATPAIVEGSPWMELDTEDVLQLAPDGLVLIQPRPARTEPTADPPQWDQVRARLGPLAQLDIPAIRVRRVAVIDDPLALTPSTAMLSLTAQLRQILQAWAEGSGEP